MTGTCSVSSAVTVNSVLPHVCCDTSSVLEVAGLRWQGTAWLSCADVPRRALDRAVSLERPVPAGPASRTRRPAGSWGCGREAGLGAPQWFSVELGAREAEIFRGVSGMCGDRCGASKGPSPTPHLGTCPRMKEATSACRDSGGSENPLRTGSRLGQPR